MADQASSLSVPEVELDRPPAFGFGEKVRSRRTVRNDGTFRGKDIGEILCRKGEIGYVADIGTFLQQFYIYGVEFIASGYRVGMKRKELESAEPPAAGRQPVPDPDRGDSEERSGPRPGIHP